MRNRETGKTIEMDEICAPLITPHLAPLRMSAKDLPDYSLSTMSMHMTAAKMSRRRRLSVGT